MSEPITPRLAVDTVVLQNTSITWNAVWDGAAWVIDPATIRLFNTGDLAGDDGAILPTDLTKFMTDLPVGAQTALQQLHDYIEAAMAAELG